MYCSGLGLKVIGRFDDYDEFIGVMLGQLDSDMHFEFTHSANHQVSPSPTVEDLVMFYIPSPSTEVACSDDAYGNQKIGYAVKNFHRITVHGSTTPLEWLKLRIDPRARAAASPTSFGPFSWSRVTP